MELMSLGNFVIWTPHLRCLSRRVPRQLTSPRGSRCVFETPCARGRTDKTGCNIRVIGEKIFADESDRELFNHHATEELLTTKGLTKFGSDDLTNHLYASSEPNRERNSIIRKGGRFMFGSHGHYRLCVSNSDSRRKVGHAHVLVIQKCFYDSDFAPDLHS